MFRDETARRGLAAHLAVAQRLVELGYEVVEPFGDHLRYDLAYYQPEERRLLSKIPAELVRIQCKTGRLLEGRSISFNAFNVSGGRRAKRGYQGQVEYFGVYCAELRKVYLIPVSDVPPNEVRLRLKSAGGFRGNRFTSKRKEWTEEDRGSYLWAEDYEL